MSRLLICLCLLHCGVAAAMTQDEAQLLLMRTGFQPSLEELQRIEPLSFGDGVDRIVDTAAKHEAANAPAPEWAKEPLPDPRERKNLTEEDKKAYQRQVALNAAELQAWWMQEMIATPTPLTERMTLFWHGHFTSAFQQVKVPQLLYRQNETLREEALGNYKKLLHKIARDPAMLLYLNNQQNRKGAPNENFARELLELFTLGEGHYSEADIKQAARAFTGWKMKAPEGEFTVEERQHDNGEKTFLGKKGDFDGDDIIDIVLKQPRAAEFIVEKLWREFVSPTPDAAAVTQLAKGFRKNWEIAPLMKALLMQPAFRDPQNDATLVKSPVEVVVGTVRALQLPLTPRAAAIAASSMGQSIFNPPNVRGWPGGETWVTSQWLLARRQFMQFVSGNSQELAPSNARGALGAQKIATRELRLQSADVKRRFGEVAESLPVRGSDRLMLAMAPTMPPEEGSEPSARLESWLLDPVYNLK